MLEHLRVMFPQPMVYSDQIAERCTLLNRSMRKNNKPWLVYPLASQVRNALFLAVIVIQYPKDMNKYVNIPIPGTADSEQQARLCGGKTATRVAQFNTKPRKSQNESTKTFSMLASEMSRNSSKCARSKCMSQRRKARDTCSKAVWNARYKFEILRQIGNNWWYILVNKKQQNECWNSNKRQSILKPWKRNAALQAFSAC